MLVIDVAGSIPMAPPLTFIVEAALLGQDAAATDSEAIVVVDKAVRGLPPNVLREARDRLPVKPHDQLVVVNVLPPL
jgi:hypothetical protein